MSPPNFSDSLSVESFTPRSRPQALALACPADILLFGGAAGSLKTMTLIADAIRHRDNPHSRAIVFRRRLKDAKESLLPKMRELYASFGAVYREYGARWLFPSGMSVQLAYCDKESTIFSHQGSEYDFIAFDESTQFTEFPVRYMLSRLRSTDPVLQEQLRVRLATNPGDVGNIWHRRMFMGQKCSHCELRTDSKESLARILRCLVAERWYPSYENYMFHTRQHY